MYVYRHICIRGNAHQSLFLEKSDIFHAIDLLAIFAAKYNVEILVYCFLSNHLHLIIRVDDTARFIKAWRVSYTHYYNFKYKTEGSVGGRGYVSGIIKDENQLVEKLIYVLRNSTRHGTAKHPYGDPFNSAKYYYQKDRGVDYGKECQPVKKNATLRFSREIIPDHYYIDQNRHIYPGCFLKTKKIEKYLGPYDQAMMKLSNPTEKEKNEKPALNNSSKLKHSDLYISQLISKHISPKTIPQLTLYEKRQQAVNIRQTIDVSIKQLSRVLNVPETSLRRWNLSAPKNR
ncbi:MAG: hypothetical protein PHE07_08160 [Bacteroidales bacterium]|nr:hypothetical protein [Bacteroidales bacterium]MDD4031390.1 hypothetical protein [Bacteroidales bacterium]MDD4435575.1 hypothetical protein [Bacteroidales bacterium]